MTPELTPVVTDEMVTRATDACCKQYGKNLAYFAPETNEEWRVALQAALSALPPSPDGMAGRLAEALRPFIAVSEVTAQHWTSARDLMAAYDAQTRETEAVPAGQKPGTLTVNFNGTASGVDALGSLEPPR